MPSRSIRLTIALLSLIPFCATAQTTVFLDYNHQKAKEQHADYYRIYTPEDDGYKVDEYIIEDSLLVMSGHCTSVKSESKEGHCIYYRDGFKSSEGEYQNNERAGKWVFYFDSSDKIEATNIYVNGRLLGVHEGFFKSGNVASRGLYKNNEQAGLWNYYFDSTTQISRTYDYTHSPEVLLTCFYPNGKVKRTEIDDRDKPVSGKCFDSMGKEIPFVPYAVMPHCPYNLQQYIAHNIHYPEAARENNITGRVIIQFDIDTTGRIVNPKVLHHVAGGCSEEAIRVMQAMAPWIPGQQEGKIVKVRYTQPISFTLQ